MSFRIWRYLVVLTAVRSLAVLLLFVLIYAAIDIVETTSLYDGAVDAVWVSYPLKVPGIVSHVLPLAVAVGVLLSLGYLKSRGEWDAFCSSGISPTLLGIGLFIVSLVAGIFSLFLNHNWAPSALLKFEQDLGLHSKMSNGENTVQWVKNGDWFISQGNVANGESYALAVKRQPSGAVGRFLLQDDRGLVKGWTLKKGWSHDWSNDLREKSRFLVPDGISSVPVSANGLLGASFTTQKLKAAVQALVSKGLDPSGVCSQIALREALSWACVFVPMMSLVLGVLRKSQRAVQLVPFSLVSAAAYWLVLAVSWNGAVFGAWPVSVVSVGVPLFWGLILSALFLVRRRNLM